ncbi:MAG: hypothetical protein AAFZ17_13755 [Cyanobacteria bacterium J06650_10]
MTGGCTDAVAIAIAAIVTNCGNRPIPISEIPAEVQRLPEGVTFEPVEQTADSYMSYL